MIKGFYNKLVEKYENASQSMQVMVFLIIVLIIGIILRWGYIMEQIAAGFRFFNAE